MKIYLAGNCGSENRTTMVKVGKFLREYNFEVYCPFELKIKNAWDLTQEEWAQKVFEADIKAIKECDAFFLISPGRESSAGSNWEQGLAYGTEKQIYVFQINDVPTSLMTYCGCNYFYNTDENHLLATIHSAINDNILNKWGKGKQECKSILT